MLGVIALFRNGNCNTFVRFLDLFLPWFVSSSLDPLKIKELTHLSSRQLGKCSKVATMCWGKKMEGSPHI